MPPQYFVLMAAVIAETIGTAALQASQQFSKLGPSLLVMIAYAISFYLLSVALKSIPLGIAYAIWSGLGIAMIAVIGFVVYGQRLDGPAILGLVMILAGILIVHLFSNSASH